MVFLEHADTRISSDNTGHYNMVELWRTAPPLTQMHLFLELDLL